MTRTLESISIPGLVTRRSLRRRMELGVSSIVAIGLLGSSVVGVAAQEPGSADQEASGASYFTGTLHLGGDILDPGEETLVDGGVEARGFTEVGLILETSDPRLSGSLARAINIDLQFMDDEERVGLKTDSWRIENELGSWSGLGSGFFHAGVDIPREEETHVDTFVLEGTGAYEGLTAYLVASGVDGAVEGIVLAGATPPFPEGPPAAGSEATE